VIAGALVNLPGNDSQDFDYQPHPESELPVPPDRVLYHGWPMWYFARDVIWPPPKTTTEFETIWTPVNTGEVWTGFAPRFRFWPFLLDISIAIVVTTAVATLFEWRRRRSSRLQFRLSTLLIGVTGLASALGWWQLERAADKELRQHLTALSQEHRPGWSPPLWLGSATPVSRLPLWLRSAIGEERAANLGINRPNKMFIDSDPSALDDIEYLVERFPSTLELHVWEINSAEEWDRFCQLSRQEVVSLDRLDDSVLSHLESFSRLRMLLHSRTNSSHTQITDDGLSHIRRLTNLTVLDLRGAQITPRGLENLVGLPRLTTLYLDIDYFDDDHFPEALVQCLSKLKALTYLEVNIIGGADSETVQKLGEWLRRELPNCRDIYL
jgi:hypothetical protein